MRKRFSLPEEFLDLLDFMVKKERGGRSNE